MKLFLMYYGVFFFNQNTGYLKGQFSWGLPPSPPHPPQNIFGLHNEQCKWDALLKFFPNNNKSLELKKKKLLHWDWKTSVIFSIEIFKVANINLGQLS